MPTSPNGSRGRSSERSSPRSGGGTRPASTRRSRSCRGRPRPTPRPIEPAVERRRKLAPSCGLPRPKERSAGPPGVDRPLLRGCCHYWGRNDRHRPAATAPAPGARRARLGSRGRDGPALCIRTRLRNGSGRPEFAAGSTHPMISTHAPSGSRRKTIRVLPSVNSRTTLAPTLRRRAKSPFRSGWVKIRAWLLSIDRRNGS